MPPSSSTPTGESPARPGLPAALRGVDNCPIEGFSPPHYDRLLGLDDSPYRTAVVCAAGYRDHEDKYASLAKVRYPASELIETR